MLVKFKGHECRLKFSKYYCTKRTEIALYDINTDERVITATFAIVDDSLKSNETIIRNDLNSKGILEVLIAANVVKITDRHIRYKNYPIVEVLHEQDIN